MTEDRGRFSFRLLLGKNAFGVGGEVDLSPNELEDADILSIGSSSMDGLGGRVIFSGTGVFVSGLGVRRGWR